MHATAAVVTIIVMVFTVVVMATMVMYEVFPRTSQKFDNWVYAQWAKQVQPETEVRDRHGLTAEERAEIDAADLAYWTEYEATDSADWDDYDYPSEYGYDREADDVLTEWLHGYSWEQMDSTEARWDSLWSDGEDFAVLGFGGEHAPMRPRHTSHCNPHPDKVMRRQCGHRTGIHHASR